MLCREEAQELQKNKPKLDALGVKLVGIVKEWDEDEIKVLIMASNKCRCVDSLGMEGCHGCLPFQDIHDNRRSADDDAELGSCHRG